jgi:hypothetical protein
LPEINRNESQKKTLDITRLALCTEASMFKSYLTTALRHLVRRKEYSFICNLFLVALSIILSTKAHAQGSMTAAQWREDLRYLQEVVTTERSNLSKKTRSKIRPGLAPERRRQQLSESVGDCRFDPGEKN